MKDGREFDTRFARFLVVYCLCYFVLFICAALTMSCSAKVLMVSFSQQSDNGASNSIKIDADNAKVTTETTQGSSLAYAGQGGVGGVGPMQDILGNYRPDLSSQNSWNVSKYKDNFIKTKFPEVVPDLIDDPVKVVNDPPTGKPPVDKPLVDVSEDGSYASKGSFESYRVGDRGRMAWRIPKRGTDLGKQIKFVFSNGYSYTVKDTAKRNADKDGFTYRPGYGTIESGTGTTHNGIFLYAPFKNPSKTVVMYYDFKPNSK